eukprot:COSAG01_NODE_2641_length_7322_cov_115.896456_1_plen_37_part_10
MIAGDRARVSHEHALRELLRLAGHQAPHRALGGPQPF